MLAAVLGVFVVAGPVAPAAATRLQPRVTAISPSTAVAGGSGFLLSVEGGPFHPRARVHWNGAPLATGFRGIRRLVAVVPASAIAAGGVVPVTVASVGPGRQSNALAFTVTNPVPALARIFPDRITAGHAAFTLTVSGSGFVPGSTVRWNGAARPTTVVGPTTLSATIPAGDVGSPGPSAVDVVNGTPGGGTSGPLTFTVTSGGAPRTVGLALYRVDGGAMVPEASEESVGALLAINDDDDDLDDAEDRGDGDVDGEEDRRDMARLVLDVQPWDTVSGTIELVATAPSRVRVFDEQDQPIALPAVLDASRFGAGALSFFVEGVAAGDTVLTLRVTEGGTMEDAARLVVGQEAAMRLTFDDGPVSDEPLSGNLTQMILDTLAANRVEDDLPAAFFVQTHVWFRGGNSVGQSLITAAAAAGHEIEIHTGSDENHAAHTARAMEPPYDVDGDLQPDGQNGLESDLIRARARILDLTGRAPALVRPTYGAYDTAVLDTYARQGLAMLLWDVDSGDTFPCDTDADCVRTRLRARVQELLDLGTFTQVVLFHDIKAVTAENLESFLETIEDAVQHRGRNVRFELP